MKWKCVCLLLLLTVASAGVAVAQTRIITGTVTEEGTGLGKPDRRVKT